MQGTGSTVRDPLYYSVSNMTLWVFMLSNSSYPSTALLNGIMVSVMKLLGVSRLRIRTQIDTYSNKCCFFSRSASASGNIPVPPQSGRYQAMIAKTELTSNWATSHPDVEVLPVCLIPGPRYLSIVNTDAGDGAPWPEQLEAQV